MANKAYLWDKGRVPKFDASIDQDMPSVLYIPAAVQKPHASVVIAPGGGYVYKEMEREGVKIAQALCGMGVSCFVLDYRVKPYGVDCALLDAQRALRFVRHSAGEYGVDPEKIGILGFSAGGHVTGMCCAHFDRGDPDARDPIDRVSCRPDFAVPCYAVLDPLTMSADQEATLREFGVDAVDAWRYCPTRIVGKDAPPAFLWHTGEDGMVPVSQSLDFARALAENGVPFDLHVYQKGPHGMDLAKGDPAASQWIPALEKWLRANDIL
jgi:acetyl esterase/lipase